MDGSFVNERCCQTSNIFARLSCIYVTYAGSSKHGDSFKQEDIWRSSVQSANMQVSPTEKMQVDFSFTLPEDAAYTIDLDKKRLPKTLWVLEIYETIASYRHRFLVPIEVKPRFACSTQETTAQ